MAATPPSPAPGGDAMAAFVQALAGWQQGQMSGASQSSKDDPPIYWGQTPGGTTTRRQPGRQAIDGKFWALEKRDADKALSDAQLEFYRWDKDHQNAWGDFLAGIGLIAADEARDYDVLKDAWLVVLDEAAGFRAADKKLTPWDVARWMAGQNGLDGESGGGGGGFTLGRGGTKKFTGTKTRTDTAIDLTDPATARALVNNVLSKALGRAANDAEVRQLTATLHAAERSSPTRTTTTYNIKDDEVTNSSSSTSGGMTEAGRAQTLMDEAMQAPDYGAYQAASTIMGWLGQALQSPV